MCLKHLYLSELVTFTMQPAPVTGIDITQLSQEQLQSLAMAARVLRKRVEELVSRVTDYLEKLVDMTPAAQAEATQRVVQEWTDPVTAAGVVAA